MDIHHLVKMANEIGGYFAAMPDHEEAVNSIEHHLRNFWEPRMRRELIAHAHNEDCDLIPIVREAVLLLAVPAASPA
jgi:formate dehydrogenase subunit delta